MRLLFRPHPSRKTEQEVASRHFDLVTCRTKLGGVDRGLPAVGRYAVIPNYREYVEDLTEMGRFPINTVAQCNWARYLSWWYASLSPLTPKTWINPWGNTFVPRILERHGGPFFLRFDSKSKRDLWKTHAYAPDAASARRMVFALLEDYHFDDEPVAVREFVPLQGYVVEGVPFTSVTGMPISKEFRIHRLAGQEICRHFYWEPFQEEIEEAGGDTDPSRIPSEWLARVTEICDDNCNFYALDVAQTAAGDWTVIEVNEGQHSGVHSSLYDTYYARLAQILTGQSND